MGWNSFLASIVFAALAAAGLLVVPLLAPWQLDTTTRLYSVGIAALYLVGIAPSRRAALEAGAVSSGLGALLLLLPLQTGSTLLGAAGIIAVCRSTLLYRSRRLRAWLLEAALLVAGLGLAGFLVGDGPVSRAFATWGYFLVPELLLPGGRWCRRARIRQRPGIPSSGPARDCWR